MIIALALIESLVLYAFAIAFMGERGQPLLHVIEYGSQVFFGVMHILVKVAPIGAFGAMGYTVGAHGIGTLNKLLALMAGLMALMWREFRGLL